MVAETHANCSELAEMEPDCKWVAMALIFLESTGKKVAAGEAVPFEIGNRAEALKALTAIDPMHAGYYSWLANRS